MRFVRHAIAASVGLVIVAGLVPPAIGSPDVIQVQDYAFTPASYRGTLGGVVQWNNVGSGVGAHAHQPAQNSPLKLWKTAAILAGSDSAPIDLVDAGTFAYHCLIHPFMTGTVKVPVTTDVTTGTVGTVMRVTFATAAHLNLTFDVERKIGTGAWKIFKTGVKGNAVSLKATTKAVYLFRARVVRIKNQAKSGWSPAATVTIS
jgi:plastocyanin